MANTREIKKRIKASGNISKITKAMEMVSAAKMRRSQEKALKSREYTRALSLILSQISTSVQLADVALPVLRSTPVSGKTLMVLISTNKGLCGALNTNLFRQVRQFVDDNLDPSQVDFVAVGKKASHFVVVNNWRLLASFHDFRDIPTSDETLSVSRLAVDDFIAGKYDYVYLAYSQFINTLTQLPRVSQFLPLTKKELDKWQKEVLTPEVIKDYSKEFILFEPEAKSLLRELIPYALETKLYQILVESSASEHSARMVAMRNANDNAIEVKKQLTLKYNKVRQSQVTSEIADIVTATLSIT